MVLTFSSFATLLRCMISLISLMKIHEIGIELVNTKEVIMMKTAVQLAWSCIYPIPFWPAAVPKDPVPSTIPVTVERADSLPLIEACLPISAQAVLATMFEIDPIKKPRMKITIKIRTF